MSSKRRDDDQVLSWIKYGIGISAVVVASGYLLTRYRVSAPSQYIVKTGIGISDMAVSKTTVVLPFQKSWYLDLSPSTYELTLAAMSNEKLEFQLPVAFTIGPKNDTETLKKFARFISGSGATRTQDMRALVKGIVEGETRVLAAGMSIEDIFRNRVEFKSQIVTSVSEELDKFGLECYNANIKELQDSDGSEYFKYLRQKTVEGAVNQAKIDVSEARMKGDIGEKERQGRTRQEVARVESDTLTLENTRQQMIAQSDTELRVKKANLSQAAQTAEVEAKQFTEMRNLELQAQVNQHQREVQTEKLRAEVLAAANVEAESSIRRAEGEMVAMQRAADGMLYQRQKEAEALLYTKQREADGIKAVLDAQARGVKQILEAVGGRPDHLLQYFMLKDGIYQQLAEKNADAVRGMAPKITIWNTGAESDKSSNPTKIITDLYRTLPPLTSAIEEQTGLRLPSWLIDHVPSSAENSGQAAEVRAPSSSSAGSG
eukprot:TRINITY_DN586_c0_g1_i11.p1 TRINITY_DN586_c0_g1~~TRINITY_DN586_c0_g1_i11.p1  ORF type:complete len:488 (+),score=192.36 TRINITY_DN586_c0_g1_i11:123-1586(+)